MFNVLERFFLPGECVGVNDPVILVSHFTMLCLALAPSCGSRMVGACSVLVARSLICRDSRPLTSVLSDSGLPNFFLWSFRVLGPLRVVCLGWV